MLSIQETNQNRFEEVLNITGSAICTAVQARKYDIFTSEPLAVHFTTNMRHLFRHLRQPWILHYLRIDVYVTVATKSEVSCASTAIDVAHCPAATSWFRRVEVTASREYRHSLPVPASCPWQHRNNIADEGDGCGTVNGRPVENAEDLWLCMEESSCEYSGTPCCMRRDRPNPTSKLLK